MYMYPLSKFASFQGPPPVFLGLWGVGGYKRPSNWDRSSAVSPGPPKGIAAMGSSGKIQLLVVLSLAAAATASMSMKSALRRCVGGKANT